MAQNFLGDLLIGKKAEDKYCLFLESLGYDFIKMEGRWKYYDIFLMDTNETVEVKNDSWTKRTGNLCIEMWSHKELQHPGWIHYTTADYLIYFIDENEFLKIPMQQIKNYVADPENLKGKKIVSGFSKGNTNVRNVLIPYTEFTKIIHKVNVMGRPKKLENRTVEEINEMNIKEVLLSLDNKLNAMNQFYAKNLTMINEFVSLIKDVKDDIAEIKSATTKQKTTALELKAKKK